MDACLAFQQFSERSSKDRDRQGLIGPEDLALAY